jgi:hypothetical protein
MATYTGGSVVQLWHEAKLTRTLSSRLRRALRPVYVTMGAQVNDVRQCYGCSISWRRWVDCTDRGMARRTRTVMANGARSISRGHHLLAAAIGSAPRPRRNGVVVLGAPACQAGGHQGDTVLREVQVGGTCPRAMA